MIGALNLGAPGLGDAWSGPYPFRIQKLCEKWSHFNFPCGDRSQTIEAVRKLVPELTSQGYRLVTVSELLKMYANE